MGKIAVGACEGPGLHQHFDNRKIKSATKSGPARALGCINTSLSSAASFSFRSGPARALGCINVAGSWKVIGIKQSGPARALGCINGMVKVKGVGLHVGACEGPGLHQASNHVITGCKIRRGLRGPWVASRTPQWRKLKCSSVGACEGPGLHQEFGHAKRGGGRGRGLRGPWVASNLWAAI